MATWHYWLLTKSAPTSLAQDPAARPSARELLQHSWITYNRRTLKSSWSRTRGLKARQAGGGPLAGGFCVCCALLSCAAQAV